MIVVPMIGVMVGYVTLRVKSADNEERTKSLNTRVDAYGTALADLRLHVETTCVKKGDLDRVEDRLTTKMDKVEHGIRGAFTTAISEMARAVRPPRKSDECPPPTWPWSPPWFAGLRPRRRPSTPPSWPPSGASPCRPIRPQRRTWRRRSRPSRPSAGGPGDLRTDRHGARPLPRPAAPEAPVNDAARAVIAAAHDLVWRERWRMRLPPDRPLPSDLAAAQEKALAALDATEANRE